MGSIISRWRRKPSTVEVLEKLEKDIVGLEKSKQTNTERQKRIIASLILYSILIYIGSALVFYFYYMPTRWTERVLYSLPLLIFPLLVWSLKRFLHWYYVKRIHKNDEALEKLKEKKKQILEDVMETETYKKAKEILEKFAQTPPPPTPLKTPNVPDQKPGENSQHHFPPGSQLVTPQTSMLNASQMSTSMMSALSATPMSTPSVQNIHPQPGGARPHPQFATPVRRAPGPPLPRPVLPRDRSVLDRLMEYLIGDGPQNRYALICSQCQSHNGMALREEFEYIGFRCCYCFHINAARKHKPRAPSLDSETVVASQQDVDQTILPDTTLKKDDGTAIVDSAESPDEAMEVDSSTTRVEDAVETDRRETAENDLDSKTGCDVVPKDAESKKID